MTTMAPVRGPFLSVIFSPPVLYAAPRFASRLNLFTLDGLGWFPARCLPGTPAQAGVLLPLPNLFRRGDSLAALPRFMEFHKSRSHQFSMQRRAWGVGQSVALWEIWEKKVMVIHTVK